jgi:hypothetical protein
VCEGFALRKGDADNFYAGAIGFPLTPIQGQINTLASSCENYDLLNSMANSRFKREVEAVS